MLLSDTSNGYSINHMGVSGLVVRVSGYISEVRVQFPALPDFLRSSGPGTGSTQTREYN
jgi:hypothetical protein